MMVRRALLAAVLLRTAAAIQVVEDPGGLAEHKEAEGRHLSRKERAVAERKARRKEAAMRAVEGSKKPGTSASQGEATGQAAGAVEGSKKPGASAAQGEAEGQSAGAEHWEAQGKPLSRKARAVAERRARREEAKRTAKVRPGREHLHHPGRVRLSGAAVGKLHHSARHLRADGVGPGRRRLPQLY